MFLDAIIDNLLEVAFWFITNGHSMGRSSWQVKKNETDGHQICRLRTMINSRMLHNIPNTPLSNFFGLAKIENTLVFIHS